MNTYLNKKIISSFALALPYIIIIFTIAGIIAAFAIGIINYAISGFILAAPALAGAIILILMHKKDARLIVPVTSFQFGQRTLYLLFGIIFTLTSMLCLILAPLSLFLLLGILILYAIIFIQIFSKNYRPSVILFEIFLTLICLIYGTTLKYPYYFGYTDVFNHVYFATITKLSGNIIPQYFAGYTNFPLYHIWIAVSSYIIAIDIKTTLFLITCPPYAIGVIFIYYIFRRVTQNNQSALLGSLLYSIGSVVIFYGTYMVTRTAAYIGFVILLYFLISRLNGNGADSKKLIFRGLAILFTIYILLVHQVSTPMIIALLLLLMVCELLIGPEKNLDYNLFAFVIVIFVAYWFYSAFNFIKDQIIPKLQPELFTAPVIQESAVYKIHGYSPVSFIFNNVDFLIFILFAIIGIGYVLWKQKPAYSAVFGLFALITLIMYIPNPLFTFWQVVEFLNFERYQLLISPFMAFVMGCGVYVMLGYSWKRVSLKTTSLIILLLFLLYCAGSIGIIEGDKIPSRRISFTSAELDGFDYVYKNIPYGSLLNSDYYTSRYFTEEYFSTAEDLKIPFYTTRIIEDVGDIPAYLGYIIITHRQFISRGLYLSEGGHTYAYLPSSESVNKLTQSLTGKDKIFSSNAVNIYL